ncbi:hypothetical protein PA171_04276 [Pseudomonas aeruginosa]|uniref:hypothetical protein n=1 Tax=Pseudomonas aeruginosa TaxID=287 RepID=UPI000DEEBDEA|nr:hypothetical protein [Pseudomonas aeruginosa]RCM35112.1 hypothetical protein PA171_04276 [Pseudomonas aeruginosa]
MSRWRIEFQDATQDNILDRMVPSDLRLLIGERDRAEAEAQALREEVAQLKQFNITLNEESARLFANWESADSDVAALRARVVVVSERDTGGSYYEEGWNACLDELARLNGLTVSEGLLRRLVDFAAAHPSGKGLAAEVGALLSEREGGRQ